MQMLGFRFCLITLFLAMGTTTIVKAADYIVPSGVTVLTEEQLLTQIVGSTFVGGTRWVHYYQPATDNSKEGRIKGRRKGGNLSSDINKWEVYGGSWKIKDALYCWEWDKAEWSAYNDCYTIALDGNTVIQYTKHGKVHTDPAGDISLISGNPNNL
jgi:hypothetical protein